MNNLSPDYLEKLRLRLLQRSKFDADGCRVWTASTTSTGYGQIAVVSAGRKRAEKAHRVAWRVANGPIPDGMCICHTCDKPLCINEEHLFLGTKADNSADMASKGRAHLGYSLQPEEIEQIRKLLKFGLKQKEIADAYGVCRPLISLIKNGKIWSRV